MSWPYWVLLALVAGICAGWYVLEDLIAASDDDRDTWPEE